MAGAKPRSDRENSEQAGEVPSTVSDFSKSAIQRAVRNEALTHPMTLFPGVLAVLGGLAWGLFGIPLFLWGAFGGAFIGATSLIVNYCFRDRTLGAKYVQRLSEQLAARQEQVFSSLNEDLKACSSIPGGEGHVTQALEQFTRIRQKYDNLQRLLEQNLGSGLLLEGRIWGASEQVYLGVLDNLRQVVTILQSIATIDPHYINEQVRQLSRLRKPSDADQRELATLNKRAKLRKSQLEKVNDILSRNEEAMTQIEEATTALASMQAGDSFAEVDPEISIRELRDLAEKVQASRKEGNP